MTYFHLYTLACCDGRAITVEQCVGLDSRIDLERHISECPQFALFCTLVNVEGQAANLRTIHEGRPHNYAVFWIPTRCPHLVMIDTSKFSLPPLLLLLLDQPTTSPSLQTSFVDGGSLCALDATQEMISVNHTYEKLSVYMLKYWRFLK